MTSSCEWNPETNAPAYIFDKHHAAALFCVGARGESWHLCQKCADLPRFKRKKRVLLTGRTP